MEAIRAFLYLIALLFSLSLSGAWLLRRFNVNLPAGFYPVAGWALYILLAIGLGVLSPFGVLIGALVFFGIAFYGTFRLFSRKMDIGTSIAPSFFAGLLLAAPLLCAVAMLQPHEWDDFSHWLPNSYFVFSHGTFPMPGQLISSAWPAYPYGFTLLIATLGWMNGNFVEAAGPLLNTALLLLFAHILLQHLFGAPKTRDAFFDYLKNFGLLALALIFINPGFSETITLSACSDFPTAFIFALLAYTGWQALGGLEGKGNILMFALLAVIFVQLRQANTYLLIILFFSLCATHLGALRAKAGYLLAALIPAYIIWLGWGVHGAAFHDNQGFSLSGHWYTELIGPLLAAMLDVIRVKWGYFGLLVATLIYAASTLRAANPTPLQRLTRALALCIAGYFAFLFAAYLGSNFVEPEIRSAASFFRYMGHLNLAVFMAAIFVAVEFARTRIPAPAIKVAQWLGLVGLPLLGILALTTHLLPGPNKLAAPVEAFARQIAPALPKKPHMIAMLPAFEGLEVSIFNYTLDRLNAPANARIGTRYTTFDQQYQPARLENLLNSYDTVLVGPNDQLGWQQLGKPAENRWALFHREGANWAMITP